jgi:hypothetical protein
MEASDSAFMEKSSFSDRRRNYPSAERRRLLHQHHARTWCGERRGLMSGASSPVARMLVLERQHSSARHGSPLRRCRHPRRVLSAASGAAGMRACPATAYGRGVVGRAHRAVSLFPARERHAIGRGRAAQCRANGRCSRAWRARTLRATAALPAAAGSFVDGRWRPEPSYPRTRPSCRALRRGCIRRADSARGRGFATGAMDVAAQAAQNPP